MGRRRRQPPPLTEEEALEEIEDWEAAEDFAEDDLVDDGPATGAGESGYPVRGRRGRDPHEAHKDRPRVIQFLIAVWAELHASSGRTARPWSPSQEWCSALF